VLCDPDQETGGVFCFGLLGVLESSMANFEVTYRDNLPGLWRLVSRYRYTREDREDLLGEVALELCRRFGEYDSSRCKFLTWAGRIVLSRAAAGEKYLGRQKRSGEVSSLEDLSEGAMVDLGPDPFEMARESQLREIIATTLSGNERRVVNAILDCRFQADVAYELGLCRAAIRPILRRASMNRGFMGALESFCA
jgi:RNA polymerase sigma factor (sigma-70 family)